MHAHQRLKMSDNSKTVKNPRPALKPEPGGAPPAKPSKPYAPRAAAPHAKAAKVHASSVSNHTPSVSKSALKHDGAPSLEAVVSLCSRRGFVFPGSSVYGGLNSSWDYGPLGVQMKRNIKRIWWESMTRRPDIVGMDSAIFMRREVWEASGHTKNFTDPLSDCKDCKRRFLAKGSAKLKCPSCGSENATPPRDFNLMFKSFIGPVEGQSALIYLRPETAQGIYINFLNIQKALRKTVPFGIAQMGKAFRNEITPSHFVFRSREFEQMEMQFFVPPSDGDKWLEHWREARLQQLLSLGLKAESLRFSPHDKQELAHYALSAWDIEYRFPFGWRELEGIHNRGDFDLSSHQALSKKSLRYFDPLQNKSFLPFVVETSIGCDRLFLALLCESFRQEEIKGETRIVLSLKKSLAPFQAAVLPLSKKGPLMEAAEKIQSALLKKQFVDYDASGSIGRRYRRQDEIGTPYCITVDFESLKDGKATVRDRESTRQERVDISGLEAWLENAFKENP